jgi:hypothetical protein
MSELTDRVRKMLSQAQVFATDTPFEAVSRARQAVELVNSSLGNGALPAEEATAVAALRRLCTSRLTKYEARLAEWLADAQARADRFTAHERAVLAQPMRAKV